MQGRRGWKLGFTDALVAGGASEMHMHKVVDLDATDAAENHALKKER